MEQVIVDAVKALERLRSARERTMKEYTGEGALELSEPARLRLRAGYGELRRAINALELPEEGHAPRVRVDLGEGMRIKDSGVPDALIEAYEFLQVQAYGGARVTPEAGVGEVGPAEQWLVKSDGQKRRGPAKRGKQFSASVRNVLKNERAMELKKKADKRLRKVARDVYQEWRGIEMGASEVKCLSCKKLAETDWKYCPRCGDKVG